ncbi:MAG TPA: SDR family oxidoreductase [Candidatus Cybelea sp.]|jgi:uncharacterized protein YbjT (DUF2867 family)
MKIVVIGGNGLIGSKLVSSFRSKGNGVRGSDIEVLAASPSTGVDAVTGAGLAQALAGAHVVVDVASSPSLEDTAAYQFFETAARNIMAAEATAGVTHHAALSIVGIDRNPQVGYFRAKLAQESIVKASGIPYTIVRSTQFFEFVEDMAQASADAQPVHASPALVQPIASDDVVAFLTDVALAAPANGTIEIAGPEQVPLDELVLRYLIAHHNQRPVMSDIHARYFGVELNDRSLTPSDTPRIGPTRFEDWMSQKSRREP